MWETEILHDKREHCLSILVYPLSNSNLCVGGMIAMGQALGWSKSWTHEVLHDLAGAGLVKLTTGKTGTVVRLLPAA